MSALTIWHKLNQFASTVMECAEQPGRQIEFRQAQILGLQSILSPNYTQYTHDKQHHRRCRNRDKHSKWLRSVCSGVRQAGDSQEDCWVGCIQGGSDDNQTSSESTTCHPPQWKCCLIYGLATPPNFPVKEYPTGR